MTTDPKNIDAREFVTRWKGVEGDYELIDGHMVALGPAGLGTLA